MSAWLTRIVLDGRHRAVRADLRDAHHMHRRLMSLFPDSLGTTARNDVGMLYRIEIAPAGRVTVLAQSTLQPDLSRLPAGYGAAQHRPLDPMLDALTDGTIVRYRIAANASKRSWKGDEHHRAGQIVALAGHEAEQWWRERATRHGLHLLDVRHEQMDAVRGQRGNDTIQHSLTRFDGTARIHDPDNVRAAVIAGIGRGKTYGCGLLSLAPQRP